MTDKIAKRREFAYSEQARALSDALAKVGEIIESMEPGFRKDTFRESIKERDRDWLAMTLLGAALAENARKEFFKGEHAETSVVREAVTGGLNAAGIVPSGPVVESVTTSVLAARARWL